MRVEAAYLALALLTTAACSDGTGPSDGVAVTLSVATPAPALQATGPARVVTQTDGTHTLELTRVALVLREIELKRDEVEACEHSGEMDDDDDCEEFEIGPILLDLPLDGSIAQVVSVDVPAGTYDELEFQVHKPESDGDDATFLTSHPDFDGVSIRVEGTFDGAPFVFLQDLSEEQELDLVPALAVAEGGGPTNVTLAIDVTGWFVDAAESLVDPSTANHGGPNEALVEENIRRSIDAFHDDDHDGHRDDD